MMPAFLPAKALGFGNGDARDADFMQRFLHLVELEGLDDCFDLFHVTPERISGALNRRAKVPNKSLAEILTRIVPRRVS